MQLYDEEATLSNPLVSILLNKKVTILKGYDEIYSFLLKGIQHRPSDLAKFNQVGYLFDTK